LVSHLENRTCVHNKARSHTLCCEAISPCLPVTCQGQTTRNYLYPPGRKLIRHEAALVRSGRFGFSRPEIEPDSRTFT
jgi:hypothetical protein